MRRVLVQNRPDAKTCPGGDTVQMEQTVRFLRAAGWEVDVSFELEPDLSGYDVAHLFNLTRPLETYVQAQNAKRQSTPYVLSPVYWDVETAVPWHAYEFPENWWRRLVPDKLRRRLQRLRGHDGAEPANTPAAVAADDPRALQAAILADALFLFPNSEAEKSHILERFDDVSPERLRVVKNGISPPGSEAGDAWAGPSGMFVCAGAIGPRKNQLNLIRAFRRLPTERLMVIGQTAPDCDRYRQAVARAAELNTEFRDRVPHEQMHALFREARACVQPSFIETPGLAAMEATAAGIPIVVADVAPVREYFGDLAHYCDPASPASIADACRRAASAEATNVAAFAERYDWHRVLEPLGRAYAQLASHTRT